MGVPMRKAQLMSQPMNFIFALVILGSIAIIGYKAVSFFTDKGCDSKLLSMQIDLSEATQQQASFTGSRKEKTYGLCDLERLYLIDASKDVSFSEFQEYPTIVNALKGKLQKNMFLVEQRQVAKDLYIPNLDLGTPYYLCLRPRNNKVELVLEGKGSGTRVYPKSGLYDCTFNATPIELTSQDLDELLADIQSEINIGDNEVIDPNDACLSRSIVESNTSDRTRVTIRKCQGNFRFVEQIPKCAVEELKRSMERGDIIFSEPPSILEADPLIMWEFSGSGDEEKYYEIKKRIEESCKTQFKGVGVKGKKEDAGVNRKPGKNVSQRPIDLRVAYITDIGHQRSEDALDKVMAQDDDEESVDVNELLHVEFEKGLGNRAAVRVYARCEPSGIIYLGSEKLGTLLATASCDDKFRMIELTINARDFSGNVFDLGTTLPVRKVEYDYVDIKK